MPNKRPSVKNEKQYEALKDKGMSKERAARIAESPDASSHGGKRAARAGPPGRGTTAQKKAAGCKAGKATADKSRRPGAAGGRRRPAESPRFDR